MSVLLECCAAAAQIMKCSCKLEAATTCQDVQIVDKICGAIFWIAGIVVVGSLVWRLIDKLAEWFSDNRKRTKEKEEAARKQKSDLIDKLLDFLKEKASEKTDNNVQQANGKSLSMSAKYIYGLLKSHASKSCAEELRKQYVELCVEVLNNLETTDTQPGGGSGEAGGDNKSGPEQQPDDTSKGKTNNASDAPTPSDIYKDVLCFLITHVEKDKFDKNDLDDLRTSCGLPSKIK